MVSICLSPSYLSTLMENSVSIYRLTHLMSHIRYDLYQFILLSSLS
jgi:hypothetical protein